MKNDKIMIIGATSGVAVELANQLKNFNIIKVSRKQIDVNINLINFEKLILKYKPKIIINCIVANGIDYCENVPQEAFKVNTALPIYIATICKKIGAKFIHFSTEAIFSGEKFNKSHSEKSKANPKTIYGISKLLADINLLNFNNVLILRVPMLFGPSHKRQLISRLLEQLKKGKKIYASNDVFSTPLYIPELAKLVVRIIKEKRKYFTKNSDKIINFSSNEYMSIYELIFIYASYLNKEKKIIKVKDSFFNKNSIKPKYLGLTSKKNYTSHKSIHNCVKDHLMKLKTYN